MDLFFRCPGRDVELSHLGAHRGRHGGAERTSCAERAQNERTTCARAVRCGSVRGSVCGSSLGGCGSVRFGALFGWRLLPRWLRFGSVRCAVRLAVGRCSAVATTADVPPSHHGGRAPITTAVAVRLAVGGCTPLLPRWLPRWLARSPRTPSPSRPRTPSLALAPPRSRLAPSPLPLRAVASRCPCRRSVGAPRPVRSLGGFICLSPPRFSRSRLPPGFARLALRRSSVAPWLSAISRPFSLSCARLPSSLRLRLLAARCSRQRLRH